VESKDQWVASCAALWAAGRERLSLSQEEFAHRAGLERSYDSGFECGVRNPTLKVLLRLAKALKTKASRLLAEAGQ
jgi:transcriptional regulator with XRE-family HTH domain